MVDRPARHRSVEVLVGVALAVPVVGFVVLVTVPDANGSWEHQPSHFWLVLGTAAIAAGLGWSVGVTARRRADARLFLVSLAFLVAASFLGLHALATPQVLLDAPNAGFVYATPVGLLAASVFALWSAAPLDGDRARWVLTHAGRLRGAVVAVIVIWGAWSLASLAPLDDAFVPESAAPELWVLAVPGALLYAIAALRYLGIARHRRSLLPLAVAAAWVLLAEAILATALADNWKANWWEWHLLMLAAFAAIAGAAHREPESERFVDLYLDEVAGGTRDVSILFADLMGFTSFSEGRSSDEVQEMLNTYFGSVIPAVQAEGGRVDRYIGDAVMVTFNVGTIQPDHARRAARAALRFQAAAAEVVAAHPDWPRFRVGVNTGPATVGVLGGGGARDYTVLGDTVNLASRLEGVAPAEGVVIGGGTLERLDGARVQALGRVAVKGRDEPVDAWLLEGLDGEDAHRT